MLKRLTHGRQWGYNAANDLQAIYLNYIGSAGGVFSDGDRFAFDNPQAAAAFRYVVGLINTDRVAPPASDTNDNGDFSRNQFLSGRMALFQSGTYNLAQIAERATFRWGVAMLPAGPAGRVSVTNGIVAAGNPASRHPDAVRQVLAWLGSTRGNEYVGRQRRGHPRGAARPGGVLRLLVGQGRGRHARSSRCSTARASPRRAVPASPPDIRRSSRTSTRCSWAERPSPTRWPPPSRRPTPPPAR